jgi:hypothetical protein
MARAKQQKKLPRNPHTTTKRKPDRARGAEEQAKPDPSPAREAGDSNEPAPGGRGSAAEDERTNLADVLTPDDRQS